MNQEILKKTIKDMERQVKGQQKIIDRLKDLIEPEIKPTPKYYEPKITYLKKYFPLDWNKKIVEINYTNGTSNYDIYNPYYGINSPQSNTEPTCPASKIW